MPPGGPYERARDGGRPGGAAPDERGKAPAKAPAAAGKGRARFASGGLLDLVGRNVALFIFLALVILASLFVENFAALDNAEVILKQSAIPAIAVIGMSERVVRRHSELATRGTL